MHALTESIILICFGIFVAFWIASAFHTKPTQTRRGASGRIIATFVLILIIKLDKSLLTSRHILWHYNTPLDIIADLATTSGLALAIWARITLAGNWSADPTIKKGHELIQNGPYAHIRHPIYSGMILMFAGLTIFAGSAGTLAISMAAITVFLFKAWQEERLLIEHFGNTYLGYKKRTKTLIPFII
jgi:protein-S-isoprenylcysteine O-methyltransferase Ste14